MLTQSRSTPEDARPDASYPLSPLQEGMLFHSLREPKSGVDIEQLVLTIDGPVNPVRLHSAWQRACERYDALRTSFRWDGERPMQEVWPQVRVPFAFEERRAVAPADRERYVEASAAEERRSGMLLSHAPLQRVRLIRFAETAHALIWTNHHAILDGRARAIVLRDIVDAYAGRLLAPPAAQFGAHIARLEQQNTGANAAFWRAYLRGIAMPTPLPRSSGAAGRSSPSGTVALRTLDAQATAALNAFARGHGFTLNVLLQAAWALLLSRHAGTPDVVFGTVRACRHSGAGDDADLVGLLINTLPVRIDVDENAPLIDWLGHVSAQWNALRDVEQTPLGAIAAWSEVAQPQPLFDSVVVYEHETIGRAIRTRIDPGGVLGVRSARPIHQTGSALTLAAAGTDELEIRLAADARRYAADDAKRLLDQLVTVLLAFPLATSTRVCDVSMLTAEERRRVLSGFNRTTAYPRESSVHELFDEHAARTPHAVAAQLGAATISYRELAAKADTIAAHLHELRIGRGAYVGLCVERSFDMLAALLGILKAGAASIALDPAHPAERVAFMLGEAGARFVLAQSHLAGVLAPALELPPARAARVLDLEELLAHPLAPRPMPAVGPDDAAHVMYTSGSTGTPKGAAIPHRAVVRTVRGADYLRFDADETFFAFVPLTFDVAILELWGPLLNGARLVLCPPGLPSLDVLAATIEAGGVTTLWLTTALFEQMVEEQLPRLRGLRQLIVGGDVMSPAHARRALAGLPGIRLLNVYGPTEATVLVTAQPLSMPPDGPIPLGAPIANAGVYVLDAQRRPVPVGVPGEVYTGGDGVALGYVNRPDLTAERFVPDPFADRPGATMYRSGDLARWRPDGALDFLGRVDTQVKIRGIRVELGEIEAALTDHPGVREAVVVATPLRATEKRLIAYVVPRAGMPPQGGELRAFLGKRLPSHMVPAAVVFLDALPLTPTGKFDRRALPDPEPAPEPRAHGTRRAPETAAEIAVAAHAAEILGLDEIGLDDDFYAYGGDSLRAMRLVARLRASFHVDLTIRDLLAAPRVGDLTAVLVALGRAPAGAAPSNLTALRASGGATPLFFLHGDLAGGGYYCRELARCLGDERPVYTIAPDGANAGTVPASVKAMARENVLAIRALFPVGPVLLGGFCNGGIVAYEMACQLERAGVAVEGVVLVDAFNVNPGPMPLRVRVRQGLRRMLEWCRLAGPSGAAGASTSWDEWHERWLARWRQVLARYVPAAYSGRVALVWTDEFAAQSQRFTAEWRRFAPAAIAGRVPGNHLTSITRHLTETSRILAEYVCAPGGKTGRGTYG